MRRFAGVWSSVVLVLGIWMLVAQAAENGTALCEATTCELANGTTCDRLTQRCPPCLSFGHVPNEFRCVAFAGGTTKCPPSTVMCTAEVISSLVQGRRVSVMNATTMPPKKTNSTAETEDDNPQASKPVTRPVTANKTATSSPPAPASAPAPSASASASPPTSQPQLNTVNSQSSSSSSSDSDLATILLVFGIIIGMLLLVIAAILVKRQCEKEKFKHRQVAAMAQLPADSSGNSDDSKNDVSPNGCAYDSYSSSLDTIPLPRRSRTRGPPLPRHGHYVDGRKFAQPLNAPLRQPSSSSRHSKKTPPRRPTLAPIPPSPATIRSESSEEFQTMLSARTDWIDDFHADVTTRENPPFLTSSSSTIPILNHPVRTESTDSHDDIDIYPDSTDHYPDTNSLHTGGTEGRMFSPASSRRQDSFYGIDL